MSEMSAAPHSDSLPSHLPGLLPSRHAVVTGGGTGIGAAIAEALLAQGHHVTLLGRRLLPLHQVLDRWQGRPERERLSAIQADVTKADEIEKAFALASTRFGPITILVNNAGQAVSASASHTSAALWQQMLDVNLTGTWVCTQAAFAEMRRVGWGRIVNIASTAGLKGYAYVSAYCAAKHGVVGLTRALALEWANLGITVNAVCPGYTDTELVQDSLERIVQRTGRSTETALAEMLKGNPQGRLVQPQEVAQAVCYLCTPAANAVTGIALPVAGGEVM